MDFARKQLEKYGWSAGKGLGKNENGISEALKPKLKRSVTGVGYDPASDFTEHWWNDLYNKAAKNLEVKVVNNKTSIIKQKDSSDFEITNNMWAIKKKKKGEISDQLYANNFVKKSIMNNGESKVQKIKECDSETEESLKVFIMTDEELFAACEGRTAHKGARHGLKALGKLARIEQQEQILLNEAKYVGYSNTKKSKEINKIQNKDQIVDCNNLKGNGDIKSVKNKKNKHKHSHKEEILENVEKIIENTGNGDSLKEKNVTNCYNKEETTLLIDITKKNVSAVTNKKNKSQDTSEVAITSNYCGEMVQVKPRKKKTNIYSIKINNESNMPTVKHLDVNSTKKLKKKKKKRAE